MIGVSEKTAEANPALTAWLSSAGLASAVFAASDGWAAGLAVFAAGEEICAAPYDLIIDFGAAPSLVRATETTPARLSFAGGAFALAIMALGFVYLTDSNSGAVAVNQVEAPVIELARPENPTDVAKVASEVSADKFITDKVLAQPMLTKENSEKSERRPTLVQAKAAQKPSGRQLTARGNPVKAPRLGTFEEVEDTSLRLADLVADIDSYRK